MTPRSLTAGKKSDNKRAIIFAAVGLGLLLIAYLGTHVLNGGSSGSSASASIKASITTATTLPSHAASGITLKRRVVTSPGPQPNTTRNPFAVP
jgi:hypothetical protein